ncbi:uncharacterized protein PRCAT00002368001 [Priceomyces carsonii]|uniref:uncharacterized protein n=1 Tax=Priceomyces carsonii TaxID=28549 RepID=UPI002EDB59A7|nr:unnamed protein product [Priceomyces carsonii]
MDNDTNETQEQIKISVFTPIIYVGVMLTAFIFFTIVYRRRKISHLTQVEPIFKENHPAALYNFLKEQYKSPDVGKDSKPHEKVMKAALLRRAVESVRRSLKLKENEPVFTKLYLEGLIGDDIFKQFEIEAKLQEYELKDIAQECETYKKGWAPQFFPVAQEICFNEALRRRLNAVDDREKCFAELWEYYVDKSENDSKTSTENLTQNANSKSKEYSPEGLSHEEEGAKLNGGKKKTSKNKKK